MRYFTGLKAFQSVSIPRENVGTIGQFLDGTNDLLDVSAPEKTFEKTLSKMSNPRKEFFNL